MVICINGMPMCGKDTFCEICKSIDPDYITSFSTVDFVKEVAKFCGWDGVKDLHNRKFLSDLKDLLTEWNNIPYKDIVKKIDEEKNKLYEQGKDPDQLITFIHVREPEEIKKFVVALGAKTLLIKRPAVELMSQSNHADSDVFKYNYDYEIMNDGTIDDLYDKAQTFLNQIR